MQGRSRLEEEGGVRMSPKFGGWLLCPPATRCLVKIYVMAKKSGWREEGGGSGEDYCWGGGER